MAGSLEVVNKYHQVEGEKIYIGRGSPFGNPFPITCENDRDAVCDKYEQWFTEEVSDQQSDLYAAMASLYLRVKAGEDLKLECFCFPNRCHGDTIKTFIDRHLEEVSK